MSANGEAPIEGMILAISNELYKIRNEELNATILLTCPCQVVVQCEPQSEFIPL